MVTEVVVTESLSEEMISAGADLTRQLDDAGFNVSASLWLFNAESGGWRLMISSPEVKTRGPKWAYKRIQSVIARMHDGQTKIPLKDITVIDSDDPLVKLLGATVRTGEEISAIRFTRNVINGVPIEDAYIYRIR